MVEGAGAWRIERSGNVVFAGVGRGLTWFGSSTPPPTSPAPARPAPGLARHPAWQVALGWDGPVRISTGPLGAPLAAPACLIPPGLPRGPDDDSTRILIWIDPQLVARLPLTAPTALDRRAGDRLRTAIGDGTPDADDLAAAVTDTLGRAPEIDPRLRHALDGLGRAGSMAELAEETGVSARRLRQLAATAVPTGLADLRRWHRLRHAGLRYPFQSAAEVAYDVGFADQAHLIRTSRALTGTTLAAVGAPVLSARQARGEG